jgi:hypothetical protein
MMITNATYGVMYQFTPSGVRNGKVSWTNTTSSVVRNIVWFPTKNRWEVVGSDYTTPVTVPGGGLLASSNTTSIPDSAWATIGGTTTYSVNVTQGTCPANLPLNVTYSVTNNQCNSNTNCNGSINVTALYGAPPYTYSINNGGTFQTSNMFSNLCQGTYTVLTKDSSGATQNGTVTVAGTAPVTYKVSLSANTQATQLITNNNYLSQTTYYKLAVNPPLPAGVTINFSFAIRSNKRVDGPGTGTISDTYVVTQNGVTIPLSSSNGGTTSANRPNCNPELSTTRGDVYFYNNLTINSSPILITETAILTITNGQQGAQSNCLTTLTQQSWFDTNGYSINGCTCCSVLAENTSISQASLTYTPNSLQ